MSATICPICHEKGERVVMQHETLDQPDLRPKGDRFPGTGHSIPAVYHPHSSWTCPVCKYSVTE